MLRVEFAQNKEGKIMCEKWNVLIRSLVSIPFIAFLVLVSGCFGSSSSSKNNGDPVIVIQVDDTSVVEGDSEAAFSLILSQSSQKVVSVSYALVSDTASENVDYQPSSGQVDFQIGETAKTVPVTIIDDVLVEGSEQFMLALSAPVNATLIASTAVARIIDDDSLESVSEYDPNWNTVGVFTQAETCAGCHRASGLGDIPAVMRHPDEQGEDVSSSFQWRHSMMAHAFDDPYFQAKMQDEINVFPGNAGFIEDKCLTCHSSMGRTHAHQTGDGLTQDNCGLVDGCYRYDQAVTDMESREGVSCTLCHQMKTDLLGSSASFSGGYQIAEAGDLDAYTIYGPFQDPHTGGSSVMQSNSGYEPLFGVHMSSSDHCASCHTLFTPTIDVDTGAVTGNQFLEQGPYFEWQNSLYATGQSQEQQCHDCHMPEPDAGGYTTRIAIRPNGTVNETWPERTPFATHSMVGGNTYMLEVMKSYRDLLGIAGSTTESGFDEKIVQTRDLLQQGTATAAIDSVVMDAGNLNIDVVVTNNTGHKLPTSYPSRRVWIHLKVKDNAGQSIFESGLPDASGRISTDEDHLRSDCLAIAKSDSFSNDVCYEQHRDVISEQEQIAIYEAVLADSNNDITHILLHANSSLKDNRLPPRGFTNAKANAIEVQTVPVGVGADVDFNHNGGQEGSGSDTVHYSVAVDGYSGPYTIETRLLFQAIRPSFVNSMHTDAGRVNRFRVMYETIPPSVEVLANDSTIY